MSVMATAAEARVSVHNTEHGGGAASVCIVNDYQKLRGNRLGRQSLSNSTTILNQPAGKVFEPDRNCPKTYCTPNVGSFSTLLI